MFKANDYLVYGKDVCLVKEIKKIKEMDYYSLVPVNDTSLKITVPVNSDKIRNLISKDEVNEIINDISSIEVIDTEEKFLESEYKRLLTNGTPLDLIKLIKTIYLRNKERVQNKKRIMDKDKDYIDKAEELLYNEFSIVLDLSFEDTREFINNKFDKLIKKES